MKIELASVMVKEFRQTFRDPRFAMVLIMAPILQLTLLGFAVDLNVDDIPTAIVDQDGSAESRGLLQAMLADRTLKATEVTDDPVRAIADGGAQTVIVIPRGLGDQIAHGRTAEVQLLLDGTDPIRAQAALDAGLRFLQTRALAIAETRFVSRAQLLGLASRIPGVRVDARVLYNPELKSPIYMVPGVAAIVLLVVTTITTAMSIAKERELGTIEQLLVTPMPPAVLLLGKVLPFALIGMVVSGVVLAVGTNLFHVPVRGPLGVLFAGTALYLLSTLGAGVFISTTARTQQQAILGGFFFIMPAIFVSGFMSPIENMPTWILPLAAINPVRYYVEILRACLLKGAGLADLWTRLLALALFGVLIFGISSLRFRKRLG